MPWQETPDSYSDKEAKACFEAALKGATNTSPQAPNEKPKVANKTKTNKKPAKCRVIDGRKNAGAYSLVPDACNQAMTYDDHHKWVRLAANKLLLSGDLLWQQMCGEWASTCITADEAAKIAQPIHDALSGI